MPVVTLPDGSVKQFEQAITILEVAQSIGAGLAKAAIAGSIDGHLVDVSYAIEHDCTLQIITAKDEQGLEILRHSTAHLLAQAVKQLFPQAQVTIGPVIEDGFYYDFAFERPFTEADLAAIEKRMTEIAKTDLPVTRGVMKREDAIEFFSGKGEHYKAKIIADIPAGETISLYQQGDFIDLCRGPHVPHVKFLAAFKLTKLSGAYWRGDSKNEMLQRVYGTAWPDKKSLKSYLHRIEEAKKRDHRKIATTLHLYHIQEEAPGMVFWHPKGWTLWLVIEDYVRQFQRQHGYQEIKTPQIVDRSLWERSGHWEVFREHMFTTAAENRDYAIKPMSCPCHIQVFNQVLRSYRDLPLRYAEFGHCHRNEVSGALHGLMRVRSMVQDDGHIFCTEDQIQQEAAQFIQQVYTIYQTFGFEDIIIKLATRPEKRVGNDEIWDKAEQCLQQAITEQSIAWTLNAGEGAFYGPKIEFSLRDCLGRVWQCGTLQVDFAMPERLGAHYIAEDGSRRTPAMLHRAALGSMERFMGILIEHYAGHFPVWLAPIQASVLTITEKYNDYAQSVSQNLQAQGCRVISDLRNEKIGYKIREHTLQCVPYLFIIGEREVEQNKVSVRKRDGQDLGIMTIAAVAELLGHVVTR